jgi:hypothetical protein
MSGQAFGWVVEVTPQTGGASSPKTQRYHVAVQDRVEAVRAVRRRVPEAAGAATVTAVTMLTRYTVVSQLRLKRGDVVPIA